MSEALAPEVSDLLLDVELPTIRVRSDKGIRARIVPVHPELGAVFQMAREFGGSLGAGVIKALSNALMLYLWLAWRFYDGAYSSGGNVRPAVPRRNWNYLLHMQSPCEHVRDLWRFCVVEGLMAALLPGLEIRGLPIPSRGDKRLVYRVNGTAAWWLTLAGIAALHFSGIFPLQTVYEQFGSFMAAAIISANVIAPAVYIGTRVAGSAKGMTGSVIYDFFMGHGSTHALGRSTRTGM